MGSGVVLVLLGCGAAELAASSAGRDGRMRSIGPILVLAGGAGGAGGLLSLSGVAFKVGALSYGGGFVIAP